MKIINTMILGVCLISVSACNDLQNWNSTYLGGGQYLSNDSGMVSDCQGEHISTKHKTSEADRFWKDNNLPKGTTDFVCKDGKAYLPNKVTDCQGNLIAKHPGGIDQFKLNNNFPRYPTSGKIVRYTIFNCEDNKVIPVDYTNK